jgi:hypothetical protein
MTDTNCSIPADELWVIRETAVEVRRLAANIVEFADATTCSSGWMTFGQCMPFSGIRAFVFEELVLFEIAYTLG